MNQMDKWHQWNVAIDWSMFCVLMANHVIGTYTDSSCTFPPSLRGTWVRGRDQTPLNFTDSQVSGLGIKYNSVPLDGFSCHMASGQVYVLVSKTYSTTIEDKRYYVCWKLVEVTASGYMLYELSDVITDKSYGEEPGFIESDTSDSTITLSEVCRKDAAVQPFTTLIKQGASPAEMSTPCPHPLVARFSYNWCPKTELEGCSHPQTLQANYTMCATKIFYSSNGVLSCMGYVSRGSHIYVNLIPHEPWGSVTCFKFQVVNDSTISGQYYHGDCTSTVMTSVTLTKTAGCTETNENSDRSSVIVGAVVGVALMLALVTLVGCLVSKKTVAPVVPDSRINDADAAKGDQSPVHNTDPDNTSNSYVHNIDKTV